MNTNTEGLRVAFIGSFEPYFTTENELMDAMQRNGMEVQPFTERDAGRVRECVGRIDEFDFVLWTSTKQHRDSWGLVLQWLLLDAGKKKGVPIVAYHLDRWWGLERQWWLDDPYFQIDLVVTADGGHEDMWPTKGINHRWLPPAISERWCQPGMYREEYACDVMFVGNWRDYGHTEWQHRRDLIQFLDKHYGQVNRPGHRGLRLIPKVGHEQLRGLDLNDAYWSAKVVVGDSCLVPKVDGSPMSHYCSDRVPETLGRGGMLIHPFVEGITTETFRHWSWDLGDWAQLRWVIDDMLAHTEEARLPQRQHSIEDIRENHTYTVRIRQLVDIMHEEGLL